MHLEFKEKLINWLEKNHNKKKGCDFASCPSFESEFQIN